MDGRHRKGQDTRERIIDAAADLFARNGYDATSTDAVLQNSGVSRGSLYHHFTDKKALFEAVFVHVQTKIVEDTIIAGRGSSDGVEALQKGCVKWIELAGKPNVRQIVLIDAPAVLGWDKWRRIDNDLSFSIVRSGLLAAAKRNKLPHNLVDPISHILLSALNELALMIANSSTPKVAEQSALAALDLLLNRILLSDCSS